MVHRSPSGLVAGQDAAVTSFRYRIGLYGDLSDAAVARSQLASRLSLSAELGNRFLRSELWDAMTRVCVGLASLVARGGLAALVAQSATGFDRCRVPGVSNIVSHGPTDGRAMLEPPRCG